MRNVARTLIALLLVVVLGSGFRWIYLYWQQVKSESAVSLPNQTAVNQLWQTTLNDNSGKSYLLGQFKGKPLVVNFWATWCEPCREEMPEISDLAQAHPEIQVLGLAIDEAAAVHEFIETLQVKYPLLIAENEGIPLAEALGNNKGVLPYTVIISADGQVTRVFFGRVNREMLLSALKLS